MALPGSHQTAHLIVSARLAVAQGGMSSEPFSPHYTTSPAGTRAACIWLLLLPSRRAGEEYMGDEPSPKVSTGGLLTALIAQPTQG